MEKDGEAPPPTPEKVKMESEESKELVKDEDHSEEEEKEEESKQIEDDDEDGPPPGWQQPPPSPPLLDMIDLPPSSPLPPTPPLPSSPRDLNMEQQDSEDEGPPPGWDNKCQLNEHVVTPATVSAISSEISNIKTDDVQQDARDEDGPQPQAHEHSPTRELVPADIKVEQEEDSEDEGPPPGWDSKCQPEPELQMACQTTLPSEISDMKTEDVQQDARDEGGPQPQARKHPSPTRELVPTDIKVEQEDSEDEGPPPGWDSKCQTELESQMVCQTIPPSEISEMKTEDVQDARDEDGPRPQAHEHPSPTRKLVPSDIKVEQEEDSEDEGPPPGWDSKCQREPESQMACQTTPPSDFKMENNEQDEEGPPPGWGSTPQQQSEDHPSVPSPTLTSGARMGCEQNNVKVVEERPQQPSRQQSIPPTKPQISAPKPPTPINNNPEMGQMVCGSCRRLLSYPRGARYVECACCLEENYVLEEHEVGQVICEGCNVLLMYPYGAPKVRCANCRAETEIGDQNRRPPLSEHRRRAKRHLKRMHSG